jgi:hypothetical protein
MKMEYPLNDAIPSIEYTRDRLLAKLFDFRMHGPGREKATDEDYELFYTYGTFLSIDVGKMFCAICGFFH